MDITKENTYPQPLAGVDEVGRGPWAGPVIACACILPPDFPGEILALLTDSKKMTAKKREALAPLIAQHAHYALGEASVEEIDELNILGATFLAMGRAIDALPIKPAFVLVDGNHKIKNMDISQKAVIKGDSSCPSIAAASIIAKVHRDKLMADLATEFPHYAWEKNAGYGTKAHQQGLADFGITLHHRKSFKPIQKLLGANHES